MFCPNCGTQNPDTAPTCSKCSFNLKGASAPKFKGTMLMNQPPARPTPPMSPAAARPAAPQPAAAPTPASKLKGTMVGVGMISPYHSGASGAPSPGAYGVAPLQATPNAPPPYAPAPQNAQQNAPAGLKAPTPASFYGGAPPGGAPFGAGPSPGAAGDSGVQSFGSPNVNPMGSTIADASPPYFGPPGGQGGFGAPPQDSPFGAIQGDPSGQGAMGQGGYAPPPPAAYGQQPAPQGFGAPPGGAYGQGAGGFPPPGGGGAGGGGYGAPQGAYGAPPQGFAGQAGQGLGGAGGFDGGYDKGAPNPGALAPVGAAMQPFGGAGMVAHGGPLAVAQAPGALAAPGVHGAKGTVRSGIMCLVFSVISFGIYQLIWFIKSCNEMSTYLQRAEPSWLKVAGLSIVTCGLYGLICQLTRCGALVQECQLRAGVSNPANKGWLYIVPYYNVVLMTEELNKAWQGPA